MSAYDDELERIRELEAEARRRREALPTLLRHPDHWKVGMRVRYVRGSYDGWGPNAGTVGTVLRVGNPKRRGSEYQVFWVRPDNDTRAQFWTTPEDVELLADETVSRRSRYDTQPPKGSLEGDCRPHGDDRPLDQRTRSAR